MAPRSKKADSTPGVVGSTYIVGLVYVLSWIVLGCAMLAFVVVLLSGPSSSDLVVFYLPEGLQGLNKVAWEALKAVLLSFGALVILLSLSSLYLSKMVLKRNHFLLEQEEIRSRK